MSRRFFFGAFFLLFLSISICAQQTTNPTTNQTTTNQTNDNVEANEENSDVVITATVRAKELKVEIVPTPKVEFPGTPRRQNVWEADRENLPAQIQPGVVYRDIGVRLRIYTRFAEIQRIVLEAIDEPLPAQNNSQPPVPVTPNVVPPAPAKETIKPPRQ